MDALNYGDVNDPMWRTDNFDLLKKNLLIPYTSLNHNPANPMAYE
jgi:hypothetical protein